MHSVPADDIELLPEEGIKVFWENDFPKQQAISSVVKNKPRNKYDKPENVLWIAEEEVFIIFCIGLG